MPKRMVDTELWNNEDIVENFTAEDRYFWLYLLTNPHNDICGVLKYSPTIIARDMGYHKDCIVNLIYRFENVHKLIYVDNDNKEIFILNWYKFNWTKSPKIISLIDKELKNIKSNTIKQMIEKRKGLILNVDTLSIPYQYPPNSNSISISNSTNKESNIIGDTIYINEEDLPDFLR